MPFHRPLGTEILVVARVDPQHRQLRLAAPVAVGLRHLFGLARLGGMRARIATRTTRKIDDGLHARRVLRTGSHRGRTAEGLTHDHRAIG